VPQRAQFLLKLPVNLYHNSIFSVTPKNNKKNKKKSHKNLTTNKKNLYLVLPKSSMLDDPSETQSSGNFRQILPVTPKPRCLERSQDSFVHEDGYTTESRVLATTQKQMRSDPTVLPPSYLPLISSPPSSCSVRCVKNSTRLHSFGANWVLWLLISFTTTTLLALHK